MVQNESEIQRDIPLLYARIQRCQQASLEYERAILDEERSMMSLRLAMIEDQERVIKGLKPRYEAASMQANIERHTANIATFKQSIEKEAAMVVHTQEVIAVLEADLQRPTEIRVDMRTNPNTFRNRG